VKNLAIVGGFAAGKTTLSEGLVQQGYTRVSFARYLKDIAATVYGDGMPIEKAGMYPVVDLSGASLMISGRQLLQQLGQAVKAMDRDFWIKSLLNEIGYGVYGEGPYVTDDCRFPYEAQALASFGSIDDGFIIIKLDTPLDVRIHRYEETYGRKPTPAELVHPSEIELSDIIPDITIDGTKSPKDILAEVFAYAIN
jgi:hypothetical protein